MITDKLLDESLGELFMDDDDDDDDDSDGDW